MNLTDNSAILPIQPTETFAHVYQNKVTITLYIIEKAF